jgi:hypothetical protein
LHPRSAPAGSTPWAAPLRAPAARRSQEVLRSQGVRAALEQRFQRLPRVRDLIGLEYPVMVGVERLEYRRERRRAISARSAGPALSASAASATLPAGAPRAAGPIAGILPQCRASAAQSGAQHQGEDSGSFQSISLYFHVIAGISPFVIAEPRTPMLRNYPGWPGKL